MSATAGTDATARCLGLLERVFATDALAAEYPLVFDPRLARAAGGETIAIHEEGEPRAACAILVREFRSGPHAFRGGLIGSVGTDAAARGRGLGTRLLARAEETLRERGCLFALLWAEDPAFYLARGYEPFSSESDTLLVSELVDLLPEPSGVRPMRPADVPFLRRIHAGHGTRVERSEVEMGALLAIPGMLTLVRERASAPSHPPQPVAYACLGRGRDLRDVVHEFGGEAADVLALLRAHLERRFPAGEPGALFLMAPSAASEVVYPLVTLGAPSNAGILGLGKLLDPQGAGELLRAVLGSRAELVWRGPELHVRGPAGVATLAVETLQALLFGGPGVRAEVEALLARLGLPSARLPLDPFAFGLDSL